MSAITLQPEHLERAYAQLRKPGWPTLAELERAHTLYLIVRGQAVNVACGRPLPPEPTAAAPPLQRPPAPQPQARRRDDRPASPPPFSPRMAQAGEYVHPDEESNTR